MSNVVKSNELTSKVQREKKKKNVLNPNTEKLWLRHEKNKEKSESVCLKQRYVAAQWP